MFEYGICIQYEYDQHIYVYIDISLSLYIYIYTHAYTYEHIYMTSIVNSISLQCYTTDWRNYNSYDLARV